MTEVIVANEHVVDAPAFRQTLIAWGRAHFRSFPWRLTEDPYAILLAEVMLHRTQARQVVPVYERAIERYPSVQALARADSAELRQVLYSLGLQWRIDLVQEMAVQTLVRYDGQVPCEKTDLLSLPGVSDYIASAVRCFAWNLPDAIIDTNTVRVVGRLFDLEIRDSSRRNRQFREFLQALVDPDRPRAYNYALLDLADSICTKRGPPQCHACPVADLCQYAAAAPLASRAAGRGPPHTPVQRQHLDGRER